MAGLIILAVAFYFFYNSYFKTLEYIERFGKKAVHRFTGAFLNAVVAVMIFMLPIFLSMLPSMPGISQKGTLGNIGHQYNHMVLSFDVFGISITYIISAIFLIISIIFSVLLFLGISKERKTAR